MNIVQLIESCSEYSEIEKALIINRIDPVKSWKGLEDLQMQLLDAGYSPPIALNKKQVTFYNGVVVVGLCCSLEL